MSYRARQILAIFIVLVIAFGWLITVKGIGPIDPLKDRMNLGLDIKGGVYVVMEADKNDIDLFMRSTRVEFVSSLLGVVIFMGLTAWDTQKLLRIGGELDDVEGDDSAHKLAIVGALALYLDFINLFLYLLRFFGRRSD